VKSSLLLKVKNNPAYPFLLVVASALLLWLGWPVKPFSFLLFIGFVPLFLLEEHYAQTGIKRAALKYFSMLYLALMIWNISTTWWVWLASPAGAVAMLILNTLLMCIPLMLFRRVKRQAGINWAFLALPVFWITFEYIHLNWEISWPWLTLGNGFAMFPWLVQWYEFTGVFGGTAWIWAGNILIYYLFFLRTEKINKWQWSASAFLFLLLPLISVLMYITHEEKGESVEIAVMQPNIDPYTEKFIGTENFIPFEQQLERFIELSNGVIGPQTAFIAWPESALDYQMEESTYASYKVMKRILEFKNQYPDVTLLTGLITYSKFENKNLATEAVRFQEDFGYYEMYNSGLFLNEASEAQFYHKSKLVPGVETMPYPKALNFVSELLFSLGGTSGGYAKQSERTVFYNRDSIGIAPSICYESIYGEFMSEYVLNGAHFIVIITNDGWWSNTPGYKQHLHYAALRAIETRRSIARSANTGISAFFNQRGDIIQQTEFWVQDARKQELKANTELTFYVLFGDSIARACSWLSIIILLGALVKKRLRK